MLRNWGQSLRMGIREKSFTFLESLESWPKEKEVNSESCSKVLWVLIMTRNGRVHRFLNISSSNNIITATITTTLVTRRLKESLGTYHALERGTSTCTSIVWADQERKKRNRIIWRFGPSFGGRQNSFEKRSFTSFMRYVLIQRSSLPGPS